MRNFFFLVATASLAPHVTAATTYGLGIATSRAPSLSLHVSHGLEDGYHFTTHYSPKFFQLTADYQRIHVPSWGFGTFYRFGFYTGAGLAGETRAENTAEELYHLRLPLGVQAAFYEIGLQTFIEASAQIGDLPSTNVAAALSTGVRAQF